MANAALGYPAWSSAAAATDPRSGVTVPCSTAYPLARTAVSSERSWVEEVGPVPCRSTNDDREG